MSLDSSPSFLGDMRVCAQLDGPRLPLSRRSSRFASVVHSLRRPKALIDGGIYMQLATTWFPPPHREISLALTAKSLGAKPVSKSPHIKLTFRRLHSLVRLEVRPESAKRSAPAAVVPATTLEPPSATARWLPPDDEPVSRM